jgi:hypothetical protein
MSLSRTVDSVSVEPPAQPAHLSFGANVLRTRLTNSANLRTVGIARSESFERYPRSDLTDFLNAGTILPGRRPYPGNFGPNLNQHVGVFSIDLVCVRIGTETRQATRCRRRS